MTEIKLDNITLYLSTESGMNVRVKSDMENVILSNQRVDLVSELIKNNYNIVNNHYKLMLEKAVEEEVDLDDVTIVSIAIVLHYLYMYNSWRSMYKKQENKDLRFNEKDFDNASAHDIVFSYFKTKFPTNWEKICAAFLGMGLAELKTYYKTREDFYNK